MQKLFIPAKNRKEAERGAPRWACRFARVTCGFIAFDSQEALEVWRTKAVRENRAMTELTIRQREGCGVRAGQRPSVASARVLGFQVR